MGIFSNFRSKGKILDKKDVKVGQVDLPPEVVPINNKIAALIEATMLTQEEFDSLSWGELAERFEKDVERIDEALALLRSAKESGITALNYIDEASMVSLREKKRSLAQEAKEYVEKIRTESMED